MNSKDMMSELDRLLKTQYEVIERKNNDYAEDNDAFSNFKFAAEFADIPVTKAFQVLIGVKIARLKELLNGKVPQNEAVEDTLLDLANYATLLILYLNEGVNTNFHGHTE